MTSIVQLVFIKPFVVFCAWFFFLFVAAEALAALPSEQIISQASHSVVKIDAKQCQGQFSRSASGFIWKRANQVVTALHVVAGCQNITVYSEKARKIRLAKIKRILRKADLALLEIDNALELPPLKISAEKPALHSDLIALGYELDSPTMSSKNLKLSFGASRLGDMLPEKVKREVKRAGVPSLSLQILRLQGHLVPGLSGAPLINTKGEVIAIGDGGLENGAVSISWALPTSYVAELLHSDEQVNTAILASRNHFSASLDVSRGEAVQCGNMPFTKIRTRSYSDIAASTDDPVGLAQLQQMALLVGLDIYSLMFDIYVNLDTGATLAIPENLKLKSDGSTCVATRFNQALEIRVAGQTVSSEYQINDASIAFENEITRLIPLQWLPDPEWSYLQPQQRFDGFMVNRKSFYGFNPNDAGYYSGQALPTAYGFETLMARSTAFVGIVAINHNYEDLLPQSLALCQQNINLAVCERVRQQIPSWLAMTLAVFLSSFPIG